MQKLSDNSSIFSFLAINEYIKISQDALDFLKKSPIPNVYYQYLSPLGIYLSLVERLLWEQNVVSSTKYAVNAVNISVFCAASVRMTPEGQNGAKRHFAIWLPKL